MLGNLVQTTWNTKKYTGSKLGSLYTFTDKDATEATIIQNWSISGIPQITYVDLDDAITVGQTSASVSGIDLDIVVSANIQYGGKSLPMQNYTSKATPTFDVPSLSEFFTAGMPLGTVTFNVFRSN